MDNSQFSPLLRHKWVLSDEWILLNFCHYSPFFCDFRSHYQEPSLDEGFTEIVHVNFVPSFRNAEEEKLYKLYLQEKWSNKKLTTQKGAM